jgi:hypothetical protein
MLDWRGIADLGRDRVAFGPGRGAFIGPVAKRAALVDGLRVGQDLLRAGDRQDRHCALEQAGDVLADPGIPLGQGVRTVAVGL